MKRDVNITAGFNLDAIDAGLDGILGNVLPVDGVLDTLKESLSSVADGVGSMGQSFKRFAPVALNAFAVAGTAAVGFAGVIATEMLAARTSVDDIKGAISQMLDVGDLIPKFEADLRLVSKAVKKARMAAGLRDLGQEDFGGEIFGTIENFIEKTFTRLLGSTDEKARLGSFEALQELEMQLRAIKLGAEQLDELGFKRKPGKAGRRGVLPTLLFGDIDADVNDMVAEAASALDEIKRQIEDTLKIAPAELNIIESAFDAEVARDIAREYGAAGREIDRAMRQAAGGLAEFTDAEKRAIAHSRELNGLLESGMVDALPDLAGALFGASAGLQSFGDVLMDAVGDLSISIGRAMIAFGIAGDRLRSFITNPIGAVAAGTALVLIGRQLKRSVQNSLDRATGGGGTGFVAPRSTNYLPPISLSQTQVGPTAPQVVGVIAGRNINLVASREQAAQRRLGRGVSF